MKSSFENTTVIHHTSDSDEPIKLAKTAGIEYEIQNFNAGKLKIICTADVYRVYSVSSEIVLEEERPKLASILGTYASTGTYIEQILFYIIFRIRLSSRRYIYSRARRIIIPILFTTKLGKYVRPKQRLGTIPYA